MALGSHASGLFANDDELADAITAAGETSGDRSWRLPLWDEYQAGLNTNFADMANVGGGGAGSVTAACFLSRFVKGQKWAHMDIAGSSFHKGGAKGFQRTSRGSAVRLPRRSKRPQLRGRYGI